MRCPACGFALMRAPTPWGVFGCTGCGGVWTDAAAAKHVQEALDGKLVALAQRASANFADRPPPVDAGARPCAICGSAMARATIAMVVVDVCSGHGTWFDRGELDVVAQRLEAERVSDEVVADRRSDAVGEAVGSAVVDVGVDVVVGILGGVVDAIF